MGLCVYVLCVWGMCVWVYVVCVCGVRGVMCMGVCVGIRVWYVCVFVWYGVCDVGHKGVWVYGGVCVCICV